jgi:hypothetical protein
VKTACEAAAAVMNATLEAAGYHRHARGQWRKRRKQREENNGMAKPKLDTQTLVKAKPAALAKAQDDGMRDLIARSRRDAAAADELLARLDERGTTQHFMETSAGMAACAEREWIKAVSGDDVLMIKCRERLMDEQRRELAGENPSPLEALLAQRVVLCDFQVQYLERIAILNRESISHSLYCDKRLDSAHKRHLSAIKALAQVRRLQLPTVQVNIGEKQVNVANAPA